MKTTNELRAEILIHQGTIDAYKGNPDKSAEFWKAVEMKKKIEKQLDKQAILDEIYRVNLMGAKERFLFGDKTSEVV